MSSDLPHLYAPLESTKQEFRLLKILHDSNGTLKLELCHVSLQDNAEWKALSYRWGEHAATENILLNGHSFLVRPTLFAFLKQMHDEEGTSWFFVDAICINQDDLAERAEQVKLMGEIYSKAEEVIVWLDQDDIPKHQQETVKLSSHFGKVTVNKLENNIATYLFLMTNIFWTRLWIVQEVLLARKLTLRCGFFTATYDEVASTMEGYLDYDHRYGGIYAFEYAYFGRNHSKEVPLDPYALEGLTLLEHRRLQTKKDPATRTVAFHEAVAICGRRECSEPRDRIFGFLGLIQRPVKVDYTISTSRLLATALAETLLSMGFTGSKDDAILQNTFLEDLPWRSIGSSLLYGLGVNPYEPATLLVISYVAKFFAPGDSLPILVQLTLHWLMEKECKDRHERILWHLGQTDRGALSTASDVTGHAAKLSAAKVRLRVSKMRNSILTAAVDGEQHKYSEWVEILQGICATARDTVDLTEH